MSSPTKSEIFVSFYLRNFLLNEFLRAIFLCTYDFANIDSSYAQIVNGFAG